MKRLLVATDFSTRSDRALRRAALLARQFGAAVTLLHAVDPDRPRALVETERRAAAELLAKLSRSLREIDGIAAEPLILLADPFEAILSAAAESGADLTVIGPHRRQILRDMFVGTTAERVIRANPSPVLMANALPAGAYGGILLAVDLSEVCAEAVRRLHALGLGAGAPVTVLHVFEVAGLAQMRRAGLPAEQVEAHIAEEERRAAETLGAFLDRLGFAPARRLLRPADGPVPQAICAAAEEAGADLLAVGTRGRGGAAKLLLGSVAEAVLRLCERDVLAVPPVRA